MTADWHTVVEERVFRALNADLGPVVDWVAVIFFAMATVAAAADPRLGAGAFVVAAGVALSRPYVGVHWPTDILAGAAWGVACGLAARVVAARILPRAAEPPISADQRRDSSR